MQGAGKIRRSWRNAALIAAAAVSLSACVLCPAALAQVSSYGEKFLGPVSDKPPSILDKVGIEQRLNQQLPLELTFTDDAGKQVQLASYFGKRPAILALVYDRHSG